MPKILAVIDPLEETPTALERCRELSPGDDLHIKASLFMEGADASSMAAVHKEKLAWLDAQVQPYRDLGYEITVEIAIFKRLYEAILKSAMEMSADLIFKPMRQHSLLRRAVITSTDWNLIRLSPTPLLLVSGEASVHGKPVLAAVDVGAEDENHAALNQVVMEQAEVVSRVLGGDVWVVNAWSTSTIAQPASAADPMPIQIAHDMKVDHLEKSKALAEAAGIPADRVLVEEGTPEFVINHVAKEIDAGVVVMGTVARQGLAGMLVGNSAESVLENSAIDVMVVKLPDFQCPIEF